VSEYFQGRYYKHQKGDEIVALIAGRSEDAAFVQLIDRSLSRCFFYPLSDYEKTDRSIRIGPNTFAAEGVHLDIEREKSRISANLRYGPFTPIRSDIMGPFRFLPMQCKHGIVSMRHDVDGLIQINGQTVDYSGGVGYIEQDSGRSFPSEYLWVQCLEDDCSISLSIADIPFCGFRFTGCIGVILYQGKEYRLATYRGVKIERYEPTSVHLRQGNYRLEVDLSSFHPLPLCAPNKGKMNRTIEECVACGAIFTFIEGEKALFQLRSDRVSIELMRG